MPILEQCVTLGGDITVIRGQAVAPGDPTEFLAVYPVDCKGYWYQARRLLDPYVEAPAGVTSTRITQLTPEAVDYLIWSTLVVVYVCELYFAGGLLLLGRIGFSGLDPKTAKQLVAIWDYSLWMAEYRE